MFICAEAEQVRDAFALAKENGPIIIFIDKVEAFCTKSLDTELSGYRKVHHTMTQILDKLYGFCNGEKMSLPPLAASTFLPMPCCGLGESI